MFDPGIFFLNYTDFAPRLEQKMQSAGEPVTAW